MWHLWTDRLLGLHPKRRKFILQPYEINSLDWLDPQLSHGFQMGQMGYELTIPGHIQDSMLPWSMFNPIHGWWFQLMSTTRKDVIKPGSNLGNPWSKWRFMTGKIIELWLVCFQIAMVEYRRLMFVLFGSNDQVKNKSSRSKNGSCNRANGNLIAKHWGILAITRTTMGWRDTGGWTWNGRQPKRELRWD